MSANHGSAILLVDDEAGFTKLLKMNLERAGNYRVEVLNDPTQTIAVAKAFRPDVIILDMVMPGMNGTVVSTKLLEDPDLREIPVIFLTASMEEGEACAEAASVGIRTVVTKPVELPVLLEVIESALQM